MDSALRSSTRAGGTGHDAAGHPKRQQVSSGDLATCRMVVVGSALTTVQVLPRRSMRMVLPIQMVMGMSV
jgi:hypothetical protein